MIRQAPIQPTLKNGDTKSVIRFAWLWHRLLGSDVKILWERYEQLYVWEEKRIPNPFKTNEVFTLGEWIMTSERLPFKIIRENVG